MGRRRQLLFKSGDPFEQRLLDRAAAGDSDSVSMLIRGERFRTHGIFESLLAENERRVRHLDGAVRHLEERIAAIRRRVQALRQEEIIEEIEVILLSAESLDKETRRKEARKAHPATDSS